MYIPVHTHIVYLYVYMSTCRRVLCSLDNVITCTFLYFVFTSQMLSYGCTRLEIGVQSVYEDVARDTNRGHTVRAVSESFQLAKDAGFKVVAHMMPDLPNVGLERDTEGFIVRLLADDMNMYMYNTTRMHGITNNSSATTTRVERFARSRVGIWYVTILRVIPCVRVKSLCFACLCVK